MEGRRQIRRQECTEARLGGDEQVRDDHGHHLRHAGGEQLVQCGEVDELIPKLEQIGCAASLAHTPHLQTLATV